MQGDRANIKANAYDDRHALFILHFYGSYFFERDDLDWGFYGISEFQGGILKKKKQKHSRVVKKKSGWHR